MPGVLAVIFIGASWKSVGGQLLASAVALLSGHQDLGLRARMGAVFGFFIAPSLRCLGPGHGYHGETLEWHSDLRCGSLF